MSRRWRWFLRPGEVAIDLTGQVVPDGNGSGRYRRRTVEDFVPDLKPTARCDGATVYERPEERRAVLAANRREPSPARRASAGRNRGRRWEPLPLITRAGG